MPRIDVTAGKRCCQKPGCTNRLTYRHHRGGERTFVKHLRHLYFSSKKEWYRALHRRYKAFVPEDLVDICGDHHEEIHNLIDRNDLDWMVENDCIQAFSRFTPEQADKLMKARQGWTDTWLKEQTPGIKTRKYTQFP